MPIDLQLNSVVLKLSAAPFATFSQILRHDWTRVQMFFWFSLNFQRFSLPEGTQRTI